jgi:ABC-type bacteriocin/lantibiotic exporter with double-glycine peptidase domain
MSINPKPLISEANIRRQEDTQWCYAAIIQMVLEYYGTKITQPEIVERITGSRTNNAPQTPTNLLTELNHTNGCHPTAILQFKKIKPQIDSKRPIIVRLSGGSGHYVLIVGYTQDMDKGETQLIYIDPNKSKYNVETVSAFDDIMTVNTIYQVFGSGEDHDGPSNVGGYCFTKPSQGAEGAKGRKGGMKSKKSRKSRSTRKKIRSKSRRIRK